MLPPNPEGQDAVGETDSTNPESRPPEHSEGRAWTDWVGSAAARQDDEATRARIQAAFAAGYEAGWRGHRRALEQERQAED